MEMLDGGDLFTKINQLINQDVKFTEREISIIFRNFIIAVNEVHEMTNFINCDLKCDNIVFINNNPNDLSIKIIDFGLGLEIKDGSDHILDNKVFGSRGLVAPETLLHHDTHDSYYFSKSTDIWQAGCILYTMLAAEPPFTVVPNSARY
jgi:serine/threonine protein kinase